MRPGPVFASCVLTLVGSVGLMLPFFSKVQGASKSALAGLAVGFVGFFLGVLLYFVARVLQVKERSLREDEAELGPLTAEEMHDRRRWMKEASSAHWRKLMVGAVWVGVPLVLLLIALTSARTAPRWVQGVLSALGLGGIVLFYRWLDQWRFVFTNRRVVDQDETHYYVQRNWIPARLRADSQLPHAPSSPQDPPCPLPR